jgi:hypothetical protein
MYFLRFLFVKLGEDQGDGRNTVVGFEIYAVANDRWRTEASMPRTDNDAVRRKNPGTAVG